MTPEFKKSFDLYLQGCKDIFDQYWENNGFIHEKSVFDYKVGHRYVKVINGSSVHSFVDMTNGNVLKPAGWSKPAKHSRGNIFDEKNGLATMGPYGPAYLR